LKTIHTLIPDIYKIVNTNWMTDELANILARDIASRLGTGRQARRALRLSELRPRCPKALWHSVHTPELAAPLPPWVHIKLMYGHILEALVLTLARAAGHKVEGEQDELVCCGVVGHRDAVIDGCVVDVKSSSVLALDKLKTGSIEQNDGFGYLDQLDAYIGGSATDSLTTVKDKGYLLGIGKELGHLALHEHKYRASHIEERIRDYQRIIALPEPPNCECGTEAFTNGNTKLDTRASYDEMRYVCWPKLRTFIYAKGPVYLTNVVKAPKDVPELDKHGRICYNGLYNVTWPMQMSEPVAGVQAHSSSSASFQTGRLLQ
jgi:hypothetical protein